MTEETKQTEEPKPTLFQVLVDAIGRVANDQKLTVDSVIGQLELVKRHVIDNVLANAQAAEQNANADTQEPEVVTPEVVEDKA